MDKPFHKRVGQHAKNFHRHFTKYLYERDTIFATAWVFIFIIVLGSLPINVSFLNPLKLGLKDFDFNDMAYSNLRKGKGESRDARIVIINIGQLDREGIAMLIEKTAAKHPKVIGLDVLFDGPGDPVQDSLLIQVFQKHRNLVAAQKLNFSHGALTHISGNYFKDHAASYGYVNFIGDDPGTIRYFSPFETEKGIKYPFFATALVKAFDSSAYNKLAKRHKGQEIINYTRRTNKYLVIEPETLLMDLVVDSVINGKIALLGLVDTSSSNIEDKKFTPMNPKFAGKSYPDMNGTVVHANIISMILDRNYIKKLPSWVNWLVAILICWLHMSFFIRYYLESHIWFHLIAKIAQILSAIFFVYLGVLLFDWYRIKLDMKLSLIVIIMAVDVIYFYEAFAAWMHKKFHYDTVFHQKHH
jgi:CHASE2 domain-containing sensor protein